MNNTSPNTLANITTLSAERYKDAEAFRYYRDGQWQSTTYTGLAEAVSATAKGLLAQGIKLRDRVAILSNTRPEWSIADFACLAIGAVTVPIYQTNSPKECLYVLQDSGAKLVFAEDGEQLAKLTTVAEQLEDLEAVVTFTATEAGSSPFKVMSLTELQAAGAKTPDRDSKKAGQSVKPEDPATIIYTSGTTADPKGCVVSHSNFRKMIEMLESLRNEGEGELAYLFLPLAHTFARMVSFVAADTGATVAFFRSIEMIPADLMELRPTYFPSVPRVFEKIYAVAQASNMTAEQVRNLFGGRLKTAISGGAPISKEILEYFHSCGLLVLEGYGMTETSTAATANREDDFKFGTVGKPFPGCEIKIADDNEVLVKGPNIFQGYWNNDEATREAVRGEWLHTGDLGELDEDGFLTIIGRKKEIVITSGGKNVSPTALENPLKQHPLISQAVVVGDNRPFLTALITVDVAELPLWAQTNAVEVSQERPHLDPAVLAEIGAAVNETNSQVARAEQIKKFKVLPTDFNQESGELTPTLKVKRPVVYEKYAAEIEALYS